MTARKKKTMRLLIRILKVLGWLLLVALIGLYIAFYRMTMPKSDDQVMETFEEAVVAPQLSYDTFEKMPYRVIRIGQDTSLPTLVFVHGSPGEAMNFGRYLNDSLLRTKANMLAYDRIGYNYDEKHAVQASIAFEVRMLEDLMQGMAPEKLILVGYSYGGPIALASKRSYKQIVLLAPALFSEAEYFSPMINFYKWKLTRWLVPKVWKSASIEKIGHQSDLEQFQDNWHSNPAPILHIHGDADWIVPYKNAQMLVEQLPHDHLELITIPGAGHDLVWSHFEEIRDWLVRVVE